MVWYNDQLISLIVIAIGCQWALPTNHEHEPTNPYHLDRPDSDSVRLSQFPRPSPVLRVKVAEF